ncbi:hypothetical protein A9Q87_04185 [Flavobacteriales bacterium 34_180_T64]|nr:hypothetical protein A9Q87_04185 [Flavobacteriales bacterium 34_180_T64]
MIRFFRRIRYRLLNQIKLKKYFFYAIGEILLVVIGILIAVGIGEWRIEIRKQQELTSYYKGLHYDLSKDKVRLDDLVILFETASTGIINEIDEMQLDSYNKDSLYSNVPAWMVYVTEFSPKNSTFTEILSSGKLQLFKNEEIKKQVLRIYSNLYPEMLFRQRASNEFIRSNRTENLLDTYRWLEILSNDGNSRTDLNLKHPMAQLNHDWLQDKQSEKYLRFENYLTLTLAAYQGFVLRYRSISTEVELLLSQIKTELKHM